ncbi:MAG: hypothetical protein HOY71_10535, partial [Nonomuraea sp.]|nr:hypothetical protein [Nonomuraea sp.]
QPAGQEERADARRTDITRLLEHRAAAVRTRDRAAFLATVDPRSGLFRDRQAAVFDNLAEVPLASWDYQVAAPEAFPLSAARRADLGADQVYTAQVDLLYRVADLDSAPMRGPQYLTFVLRDGAWSVAADDDGESAGLHTAVNLWDLGPVTALRSESGIVLGIGSANDLKPYQKDMETAVPDVTAVWGKAWAGEAVVVVPANQEQMARLLGAEPQKYARIAAVTTGERGAAVDAAPADRVIVNPEAFRELGAVERRVVMTHEITHVATRAYTRTWTPTWLSEGFADYIGYLESGQSVRNAAPELRRDVRDGKIPQSLPSDAQFETTQDALPQAYEMGWLAGRMIAERWGQAKLVAFYRAVGEAPPQGTSVDQDSRLAGAMVSVLGMGPDEFTRQWVQYVRMQVK